MEQKIKGVWAISSL